MDPTRLTSDSLEATYAAPAASSLRTGRMTIEDVTVRTASLFAVLLAVGAVAWGLNNPGLAMIGFLAGFALAMVITFSKKVRPPLILTYAGLQGLALGSISRVMNDIYPGIVSQAVIATICAFGGMLFAYRSGKIRVTPKFTRILIGSLIGYFALAIVTLFTGAPTGTVGTLIAVFGVGLASFFIVLDFDQIERSIAQGVPQNEAWRSAFGLMVTLVWLYMEVLRLISILRSGD